MGSPFFFFFLKRICIALFNTRPVFRCKSSPAKGGLRAFRYTRGFRLRRISVCRFTLLFFWLYNKPTHLTN